MAGVQIAQRTFQAVSCPFWLRVPLAKLGSQAQNDYTFFRMPAMAIDSCFANRSALRFTRAAAGSTGGRAGWKISSCGTDSPGKRERDPEVKFTLGQICVLNTS